MKKFIYKILILSVLCCNTIPNVRGMNFEKSVVGNEQIDVKALIDGGKKIDWGTTADLYTHESYPGKVIKHYRGKQVFKINDSEDVIASKLMGNDVPKSLMKCFGVLDKDTIVYEYIKGTTLKNWLSDTNNTIKIPFDIFCKDWVLEMFEGMKYFSEHVKIDYKWRRKLGGKEFVKVFKDVPRLPGDMSMVNIMVRYPTENERYPTPVRIDYDQPEYASSNTDVLMRLAGMLGEVMQQKVEYTDEQKSKFEKLFEFLNFNGIYDVDKASKYWFDIKALIEELRKIIG